jgi:hypothetical protein
MADLKVLGVSVSSLAPSDPGHLLSNLREIPSGPTNGRDPVHLCGACNSTLDLEGLAPPAECQQWPALPRAADRQSSMQERSLSRGAGTNVPAF